MKHDRGSANVTFIVVGWNNKSLLYECFESIEQQSYKNHATIYVDNGSSDESLAYVKSHHPRVVVVDARENLGFAIGNNMGIKRAFEDEHCRHVALLNTDARIGPDWLEKLIGFANDHPKGAAFQSPTYDYYAHSVLDSRGIKIDHLGQAVQLGYRDKNSRLETRQVFGVNAAAALFSRSFLEAQPFGEDYLDSDLWMYLEDVDIAARATIMGWQNWFVNQSCAYHMGSASSNKNPGFSVYMVYRNNLPMLVKNLPLSIMLRLAPGLILSDLHSLYRLWRGHNYIAIKSIIRGRWRSLAMLPKFIVKRRRLKKERKLDSKSLWRLMADS